MKTINQKIRDVIFNPISIKKQRDNKKQVDFVLKQNTRSAAYLLKGTGRVVGS